MKKLKRVEKILLLLIATMLICAISTHIKATEGDPGSIIDINVINTNKDNQNTNTNEPATNTNTNNNINTNKESSLPKTGANDTAMWVVIGTCVVLAIYAYKKVRDYNV